MDPDGFKQPVTIPVPPVIGGNYWLISLYKFPIETNSGHVSENKTKMPVSTWIPIQELTGLLQPGTKFSVALLDLLLPHT